MSTPALRLYARGGRVIGGDDDDFLAAAFLFEEEVGFATREAPAVGCGRARREWLAADVN